MTVESAPRASGSHREKSEELKIWWTCWGSDPVQAFDGKNWIADLEKRDTMSRLAGHFAVCANFGHRFTVVAALTGTLIDTSVATGG